MISEGSCSTILDIAGSSYSRGKLEYDCPTPIEKKENQHKSSQAHFQVLGVSNTFCRPHRRLPRGVEPETRACGSLRTFPEGGGRGGRDAFRYRCRYR